MKIICLSDFHGKKEYLDSFIKVIKEENPGLIFFAGDMVKGLARGEEWLESQYRGWVPNKEKEEIKLEEKEDREYYQAFYQAFGSLGLPVMLVPGNMDAPWPRFIQAFEQAAKTIKNITLVHGLWLNRGDYLIAGFGGEITEDRKEDFFMLQFPGAEVKERMKAVPSQKRRLMLFHTPPFGHLDVDNGRPRGIKTVLELIEAYKPLLVTFGHSHKARGKEMLADTLLVNPGAMKDGWGAVVELEKKEVRFFNVL